MNKNQKGFSALEILIALLVIGVIAGLGLLIYDRHRNESSKQSTSSNQVQTSLKGNATSLNQKTTQAADAFIISRVGEERFHKYFKLDTSRSNDSDPHESNLDSRAYHFSLLKKAADDDLIVVQVNKNDASQTYANLVPDCVKDATLCDFNITKQQALSIARKNGFTASDLETSWDASHDSPKLAIKVSSCSQNKSMWIDYQSGRVTGFESVINCGGTP